jgi:hypothetical protein
MYLCSPNSVVDVFEKALEAGFIQATDYVEIWQVYLDYLRRRVDFCKGENCCCNTVKNAYIYLSSRF